MTVETIYAPDDLALCPVCANPAQMRESKHKNYSQFCVECADGKCRFKTPWLLSLNEATRRWNKRKPAPGSVEEKIADLERLHKGIEQFADFMKQRLTGGNDETRVLP